MELKRIDLKTGFNCNNRCKFCVQGDKRDNFTDKTTADLKEILSKSRNCYNGVIFTGGESTIRKDIFELVKYAKCLNYISIQIQTNGRMFAYRNFCDEIISAGANEFAISIHGHKEKIHDFLTSVKGSFREAVKGIVNLISLNACVLTNTVINSYNYKYLPNIAEFLIKDLHVNQFQFSFIHIAGTACENKRWIVPKKSKIIPFLKEGLKKGLSSGKKVTSEGIPYCLMKGYENYISENSIPKTKVFDADFIIKDFTKYRISEGKAKSKSCKKCKYYYICEGPWKEYPQIFGWDEFKPII